MIANKKQRWGLLVLPAEMLIDEYIFPLLQPDKNPKAALLAFFLLFSAGFFIMIWLFHDFLSAQWQIFRQKLFQRLLLSILLVIGVFLILHFVRVLIPSDLLTVPTNSSSIQTLSVGWTVLAAMIPFIAPFTEELTFRYLLLGKISNKIFRFFMLFVQGILFGLIHWHNFNGNIYAMIPYMAIGIYLGLIYLIAKNIWAPLMVHWMFNAMNSLLPALLLLFLNLFGMLV
ncbi:CPBP family intramembrane metalloprotease [Enterococcus pseudoavium]|uniref:CPBP family intramembrane metalloprotease n=1 Tax=Enterococcus pseudoavium TaxID=44007 RepID=A0AAE4I1A5_9ENTE|nr:CPBP family intramembrane glutamic endopeptidase [Enterococcus pseudoavium]MDT2737331.1 CPBP family intramembrane metalloprotease [Enterococcus pseudoavium]